MKRRTKKIFPPYFKWRDGRPRWEPGPGLRAKGWRGRDLRDEAGAWLGMEAAIAVAVELNAAVAAGATQRRAAAARKPVRTISALYAQFAASSDCQRLAHGTQLDYRSKFDLFLADFGDAPVSAIGKPHLVGWWEQAYRARGHAMANGMLAVVRRVLAHAELIGWRPPNSNPALRLARPTVPPRVVVWLPGEPEHLVATADAMGMASIGDAVVLALHTAQRQGDVLRFEAPTRAGGRLQFRQSKRGARVSVPATPQIEARIAAITARRRAGPVAQLAIAGPLIVSDRTGRPYTPDTFRRLFRDVRAEAARTLPALADRQFLDLRDTAITRLALAGCTVPEIRAISGHEIGTIHQVLRHYIAQDDAMADTAIAKLTGYMEEEGIAL